MDFPGGKVINVALKTCLLRPAARKTGANFSKYVNYFFFQKIERKSLAKGKCHNKHEKPQTIPVSL